MNVHQTILLIWVLTRQYYLYEYSSDNTIDMSTHKAILFIWVFIRQYYWYEYSSDNTIDMHIHQTILLIWLCMSLFPFVAESTSVLESSFSKSDTEIMSIGSSSKENVSSPHRRKTIKNLTVVHMRSSSEPTHNTHSPSNSPGYMCSPFSPRDRKFSYPVSGEQSPRRAFQEL